MRLAEGQIRRLVANRSGRPVRDDRGRGQREIGPRHAGIAADEEIRPGGASARLCRDMTLEPGISTAAPTAVFAVFRSKITAADIRYGAEMLGCQGSGDRDNSETTR